MHTVSKLLRNFASYRFVVLLAAGMILVVISAKAILPRGTAPDEKKWTPVERRAFRIELIESGEIRAVNSYYVTAPHEWSSDLQIIDMAPEGIHVKKGDFLIHFDESIYKEQLESQRDILASAEADVRRSKKEQEVNMSELESQIQMARYSKEAAEISLELLKFESEISQEEARLELKKSVLSLEEAQKKIYAQKLIDGMKLKMAVLNYEQIQKQVNNYEERIRTLTMYAPISGMVVYQKIGGWNSPPHKVAVGDKPRPGEAVLNISDLSSMEMVAQVNEFDVNAIKPGQKAVLRLDAFSESTFQGTVASVSPLVEKKLEMWRSRRGFSAPVKESTIDVPKYQVIIRIDGSDPNLKPGMTAQATILLEEIPDVLFVPMGAVFEWRDSTAVVFTKKSQPDPVKVKLGKRNERFVVIEDGLTEKDLLFWIPPSSDAHPLGWFREMERRRKEQEEILGHIASMDTLGVKVDVPEKVVPDSIIQLPPPGSPANRGSLSNVGPRGSKSAVGSGAGVQPRESVVR